MRTDGRELMEEPEDTGAREQLELFELIDFDDPRNRKDYSNSIDIYDNVPKYSWNQREVVHASDSRRTRSIKLGGQRYDIAITPAWVTRNGERVMVYPGVREELVEEALRKFVVEGQGKAHRSGVGVMFTMYQLQKELADNGRTYSLNELQEALQVCNGSILEITTPEGKSVLTSPLFPTVVRSKREDYLRAPTAAKCYVQFNALVSDSILNLKYRRYDYQVGMSIRSHLARWIHRRMSHNWTQASVERPYTFSQLSYLASSPRGISEVMSDNTRAVKSALNVLIKEGIISNYKAHPEKEGRRIVDVKYEVFATKEFVSQMISHNTHGKKLSTRQFQLLRKNLSSQAN